ADKIKGYFQSSEKFESLVREAIKIRQSNLPRTDEEIKRVKTQLRELENAEADLRKQLLDESVRARAGFLSWLELEVGKIQSQKDQLSVQLEYLERHRRDILEKSGLENLRGKVTEFVDRFDELSDVEKRTLVEQIVKRIVVRKDNKLELHVQWSPPGVLEDRFLDLEENGRGDWI